MYDYQISCTNELIQKINLKDIIKAKSISIYNKSKVILKCSNNTEHINLYIYDNCFVKFENDCIFNTIVIYNSSKIDLSLNKITAERVILHNHSSNNYYNLSTKNLIYQKGKQRIIDCDENLHIWIKRPPNISCGIRSWKPKKENELNDYQINLYDNNVYIHNLHTHSVFDLMMRYFYNSFHFYGNVNIFIEKVGYNESTTWAKLLKNKFNDVDLQVYFQERKIYNEINWNLPEWRYFNTMGNSIFDNSYYYYYYIEPIGELIIIPTTASIIIIITIISLIIIIIISTYLIGIFCHKS